MPKSQDFSCKDFDCQYYEKNYYCLAALCEMLEYDPMLLFMHLR